MLDPNTLYPIDYAYAHGLLATGRFKLVDGIMSVQNTPIMDLSKISKTEALRWIMTAKPEGGMRAFIMHTPVAYVFSSSNMPSGAGYQYDDLSIGGNVILNDYLGILGLAEYPYKPITM